MLLFGPLNFYTTEPMPMYETEDKLKMAHWLK